MLAVYERNAILAGKFQRNTVDCVSPRNDYTCCTMVEGSTDLDFTEHLWEFCKTANSFSDLRSILAVVFRYGDTVAFVCVDAVSYSTVVGSES